MALAAVFLVAAAPAARVKEITLENGLKVLLLENHTAPIVSVWAWYRVGSQHEHAGATGMAHLVEHLTYEGTEQISRAEMTGLIERQGGAWNGYTWLDETAFYETAPAASLDSLLGLESQRMGKATFPEAAMEPLRNTVLGELDAGNESPAEALDQEVVAAAFKTHPYRTPTVGWRADVTALTREDALAFYYEWYVPSAATLVVVGDFKIADAAKLVHARFDGIPQGTPPGDSAVVEPPQEGERRVAISRSAPARFLEIAYRAPAVSDPDFAAFLVADAVLGGAKGTNIWNLADAPAPRGTRLYRALIASGLGTEARSAFVPTRASYLDALRVVASEGPEADRVEAAAIAAAESIANDATSAEVDRARSQLAAKLVFESASDTDLAHQLGYFQSLDPSGLGWRRVSRLPADVAHVSVADVKRVAAKYFVAAGRTVGWLTSPAAPKPPEGKRDGKKRVKASAKVSRPKTWRPREEPESEPAPTETTAPTTPPAPAAPSSHAARKAGAKTPPPPPPPFGPLPVRQVLPNGVVVLAVRNPIAPEVEVRIDVLAGGDRDVADKAGAAALCGRLLASGGGAHGELQVADAFDAAGATLDASVDAERTVLRSRMLAGTMESLLPIMKEMVVSPSFPKDSFDREKTAAIAEARARQTDPDSVAESALRATLYPAGDPRTRDPHGSAATLEGLARVDLAEFHRRFYRPDAAVIAISGDVDPQAAIRAVKKSFGTWKVLAPAPPKTALTAAPEVAPGTGITRVPVETSRAQMVIGGAGLSRGDPDRVALAAVRVTLEARLSKALRDDASLARWVETRADEGVHAGPLFVRAGVAPVSGEAAISAAREVLAALAKEGPTEAEFGFARTRLQGLLARDLETNRDLAATLVDAERDGEGAAGARAEAARLQGLTLEDAARAARTWLPAAGPAVLAGPKK